MIKRGWVIAAWLMVCMAITLLAACSGSGGGASAAAASTTTTRTAVSDALFTDAASAVNITVTTDATKAVSQLVTTAASATLATTDANGNQYTLVIPANALVQDTTITMTPIASVTRLPLANGMVAGVQFAPDGLFLYLDATLTIVPAANVPVGNQTFMGFSGAGNDLHLVPPATLGAPIVMSVGHFSGNILGNGTSAERASLLLSRATDHEARLQQEIARVKEEQRQSANNVQSDGTAVASQFANFFPSYYGLVVRNRILAAGASCSNANLALRTYLWFERQIAILGVGDTYDPTFSDLAMITKAIDAQCNVLPNRYSGTFTDFSGTTGSSISNTGTVTYLRDDAACMAAGISAASSACYLVESVTYTSTKDVSATGCTIAPASHQVTLTNTPLTDSSLVIDLKSMISPTYGTQTGIRSYTLIGYWSKDLGTQDTVTCPGPFSYPAPAIPQAALASDPNNRALVPQATPQVPSKITGSYTRTAAGTDSFTWDLTGGP